MIPIVIASIVLNFGSINLLAYWFHINWVPFGFSHQEQSANH